MSEAEEVRERPGQSLYWGFPPGWLTGQGKLFRMGGLVVLAAWVTGAVPSVWCLALGDSEQGNPSQPLRVK